MKKLFVYIVAGVAVSFSSCKKTFDEMNIDSKSSIKSNPEYLLSNAEKNLMDIITSANVNRNVFRLWVQQWTQTTYLDESRYDMTTRKIPDNWWTILYRDVLRDLKASKDLIQEKTMDADVKKAQLAVIDVLECYTFSILVNTFGNIPYAEALDINNIYPKYEDGKAIMRDLISRLEDDVTTLKASTSSFPAGEIFYNGSTSKWAKLASSIGLKLATIQSEVSSEKSWAEGKIVSFSTDAFTSNSDNAIFKYLGATPNNNPISNDLNSILTSRKDFVGASTMINVMLATNDPRISTYYAKSTANNDYKGGTPGSSNSSTTNSRISSKVIALDFQAILMDYSEVEFLRAEAAAKGLGVTGSAEDHYKNGILSSISYWKAGDTAGYSTYIADSTVVYNSGQWKKQIAAQKWLALYNRGFDAWIEYRRLDFPVLVANPGQSINDLPKRMTYPISEQSLNNANRLQAASSIGGDLANVKLYWDIN